MNDYKFCPVCSKKLETRQVAEQIRPACPDHNCGFIYYEDPKLVTVVLMEQEGQLLLGRRNHNPGKGQWSFFGGFVNRGEKVEEAAVREVKEETNLDIQLGGLVGVYSETGNPVVIMAFSSCVLNNLEQMRPQPDEVMEMQFFAFDKLPDLAFPYDLTILADWRKLKGIGTLS